MARDWSSNHPIHIKASVLVAIHPLNAACTLQALKLLGKFGGRNRRFLMDPLELDLKSNPEHGLRLILTFQPATSFLVPLDRCLALASQNLFSTNCKLLWPIFI